MRDSRCMEDPLVAFGCLALWSGWCLFDTFPIFILNLIQSWNFRTIHIHILRREHSIWIYYFWYFGYRLVALINLLMCWFYIPFFGIWTTLWWIVNTLNSFTRTNSILFLSIWAQIDFWKPYRISEFKKMWFLQRTSSVIVQVYLLFKLFSYGLSFTW